MELFRGPAPGVLIVLAVLGLMGEGQAPKPESKTHAERMAADETARDAARIAAEKNPALVELRKRYAEQAAAERARRYEAARNGEELYTPDPYRMNDCRHYAAAAQGRYSPEFEKAMKAKFFPALTDSERAAWQWDRFKRWAADLAGRPGFVCDLPPAHGGFNEMRDWTADEQAAYDLYRQAWEERGRRRQRVRADDLRQLSQAEIRREVERARLERMRQREARQPSAADRELLEYMARQSGEVK